MDSNKHSLKVKPLLGRIKYYGWYTSICTKCVGIRKSSIKFVEQIHQVVLPFEKSQGSVIAVRGIHRLTFVTAAEKSIASIYTSIHFPHTCYLL